jgi:hypothetical protein
MILEPSVTIMIETHSKVRTASIKLDNHMVIIQIQVGKNIVEDFLLDGGATVNIIIKNFITKLGLPKPRPAPYHLGMANQSIIKTFKNHKRIEDSHTWYTICNHIYCFAK